MDIDYDKIDDCTLALLYLVSTELKDGPEARAWKSFDWATADRLHEKGFISDPKTKSKSVVLTEKDLARAKELFENWFAK